MGIGFVAMLKKPFIFGLPIFETMMNLPTIFYCDDDHDDLELFKDAVDLIDEPVKVFSLGDEMLRQLRNPPPSPSLVFLDLNMPIKSGIDVLKEIRLSEAFGKLPVIIFSTTSNPVTIQQTKDLGADLFITKPPSLQRISECVKSVLKIDWDTFKRTDKNYVMNC